VHSEAGVLVVDARMFLNDAGQLGHRRLTARRPLQHLPIEGRERVPQPLLARVEAQQEVELIGEPARKARDATNRVEREVKTVDGLLVPGRIDVIVRGIERPPGGAAVRAQIGRSRGTKSGL
jgi:hypothetical protein